MINGTGNPQQVNLNQQISITLPLGVWEQILGMVAKQPWDAADPIIQECRRQIANERAQQAAEATTATITQ